jgi:hypothetical protein
MRDTPLTNPRSLSGSLGFHLGLLGVLSLAVLGVVVPSGPAPPVVIQADLAPVDNRVPAEAGGGGPGEVGGQGPLEAARITVAPAGEAASGAASDPVLDALMQGSTPLPPEREAAPVEVPGLELSRGVGVLPGPGLGGGGGSGGGSGGGIGRGVGPSTEFFGARARGSSFAYVIDRSGSMIENNALRTAKQELLASLDQLPPDAKFLVIFYNQESVSIADSRGRSGLRPATSENKEHIRRALADVQASGGTDHAAGLRMAFAAKPDAIFFLTDAQLLRPETAVELRQEAGFIPIQVIEFGAGPAPLAADPLQGLALATGGTFRYVDVLRYHPRRRAGPPEHSDLP